MAKKIMNSVVQRKLENYTSDLDDLNLKLKALNNEKNQLEKEVLYIDDRYEGFLYKMNALIKFEEVNKYAVLLYANLVKELANAKEGVVDTSKGERLKYAVIGMPTWKTRGSEADIKLLKQQINAMERQLGEKPNISGVKNEKEDMKTLMAYENVAKYASLYNEYESSIKEAYQGEDKIDKIDNEIKPLVKDKKKIEVKIEKITTKYENNLEA